MSTDCETDIKRNAQTIARVIEAADGEIVGAYRLRYMLFLLDELGVIDLKNPMWEYGRTSCSCDHP